MGCRHTLGANSCPLAEITSLHHIPSLEKVLRTPAYFIPLRAIFARSGQGWKKRRCSQAMTWSEDMKNTASAGTFSFPEWA